MNLWTRERCRNRQQKQTAMANKLPSRFHTRGAAMDAMNEILARLIGSDCNFTLRHIKKDRLLILFLKDDAPAAQILLGSLVTVTLDSYQQFNGECKIYYESN